MILTFAKIVMADDLFCFKNGIKQSSLWFSENPMSGKDLELL